MTDKLDNDDLCLTPATELAAAIRSRDVSPVDIVEAVLARIESLNEQVNAFITVDADGALESARAAEAAVMAGEELGPLHGLPVSIKDLEPVAGLRCTYGSKFFEANIADIDGIVTERTKAAGGIIIGKTNACHSGHKDMCDNLIGPPCRNPWKLDRTSGGSSGGAGAAVVAGLGPLAQGSDGAGSIRIPAALCGTFGLKPSFGRIPHWPNKTSWRAIAHDGPLTRTVADAALYLQALAGPDPRDPASIDSSPDDYVAAVAQPVEAMKGLRVAWSEDLGYAAVDPEVRELTRRAAERFSDLGCHVEAVDPGWDNPQEAFARDYHAQIAWKMSPDYDKQPDYFEPSLAFMIEAGRNVSAEEIVLGGVFRTNFYHQVREFFQRYDLLMTPQMPIGAWSVEQGPREIDGIHTPSMFDRLPFTVPFNWSGYPAASVPCGFTSEGLPVALQVVGRWHADSQVLQAAASFEQAAAWAHRWPAL